MYHWASRIPRTQQQAVKWMNLGLWNNDIKRLVRLYFITLSALTPFLSVSEQFKNDLFQSTSKVENWGCREANARGMNGTCMLLRLVMRAGSKGAPRGLDTDWNDGCIISFWLIIFLEPFLNLCIKPGDRLFSRILSWYARRGPGTRSLWRQDGRSVSP